MKMKFRAFAIIGVLSILAIALCGSLQSVHASNQYQTAQTFPIPTVRQFGYRLEPTAA